jgi:hypothetical protein
MVGIDRRLLQNVDWPLLGATVGLVVLSASTLASLQVGSPSGSSPGSASASSRSS